MARRIENRSQKKRSVTIIGEGITEQYYFTHIRTLYGYHFTIKPYYFSVTSLVEMDKKIAEAIRDGGYGESVVQIYSGLREKSKVSARNKVGCRFMFRWKIRIGESSFRIFWTEWRILF